MKSERRDQEWFNPLQQKAAPTEGSAFDGASTQRPACRSKETRLLKQTLFAATALIGLASAALPLMSTPAAAAACTSQDCGGGPPPPGGGNPPPPDGGPPPPGGGNPPPPDGGPPPPDGGGGSGGDGGNLVDDPNYNPDGTRKVSMLISCQVPKVDVTTDVMFRNIGEKTIPSGTPVTWYVKTTGQGGQFLLSSDLPVGQDLTAADLLKLGVPADTQCYSKLA
jgi:hypothetical protein